MTPITHRDLKSPNILVRILDKMIINDFSCCLDPNAPVCAKIADFGLTTRMYVPALRQKVGLS
jgi:serine/threonine protein kinase